LTLRINIIIIIYIGAIIKTIIIVILLLVFLSKLIIYKLEMNAKRTEKKLKFGVVQGPQKLLKIEYVATKPKKNNCC
jgi:hypothetical protein